MAQLIKFSKDNYVFKVVDNEENNYPKSIFFIAYNDTKQSINYMYFFDFDKDCIGSIDANAENIMVRFIEDNFPYDWD